MPPRSRPGPGVPGFKRQDSFTSEASLVAKPTRPALQIRDPAGTLARSERPFPVPLLQDLHKIQTDQGLPLPRPPRTPQSARGAPATPRGENDLRRSGSLSARGPTEMRQAVRPSSEQVARRSLFAPASGGSQGGRGGEQMSQGPRGATANSRTQSGGEVPGEVSRGFGTVDEQATAVRKSLLDKLDLTYLKTQQAFLHLDQDRDGRVTGKDLTSTLKEMNVDLENMNVDLIPALLKKCGVDKGMDFVEYAETQRQHNKMVPSPDFSREPNWVPDEYFAKKWAQPPQPPMTPPRTPAYVPPGFLQVDNWPTMFQYTPRQEPPRSARKSTADRDRIRAGLKERFRHHVPIVREKHADMVAEKHLLSIAALDGIAARRAKIEEDRQATIKRMSAAMIPPINRPPADAAIRSGGFAPNWNLREGVFEPSNWKM